MTPNVANTKEGSIDIYSNAPKQTFLAIWIDSDQDPKSIPRPLKQDFSGKEELYEEAMTLANTKLTTDRNTSYLVFFVVVILLGPVTCCAAPLLWMLWSCVNPAHQKRKHHMESVVFAPWADLGLEVVYEEESKYCAREHSFTICVMKVEYIDTDARQESGTGESLPSIIRVTLPPDAMHSAPAQDNSITDQDALPKILGAKTEAKKASGADQV